MTLSKRTKARYDKALAKFINIAAKAAIECRNDILLTEFSNQGRAVVIVGIGQGTVTALQRSVDAIDAARGESRTVYDPEGKAVPK